MGRKLHQIVSDQSGSFILNIPQRLQWFGYVRGAVASSKVAVSPKMPNEGDSMHKVPEDFSTQPTIMSVSI